MATKSRWQTLKDNVKGAIKSTGAGVSSAYNTVKSSPGEYYDIAKGAIESNARQKQLQEAVRRQTMKMGTGYTKPVNPESLLYSKEIEKPNALRMQQVAVNSNPNYTADMRKNVYKTGIKNLAEVKPYKPMSTLGALNQGFGETVRETIRRTPFVGKYRDPEFNPALNHDSFLGYYRPNQMDSTVSPKAMLGGEVAPGTVAYKPYITDPARSKRYDPSVTQHEQLHSKFDSSSKDRLNINPLSPSQAAAFTKDWNSLRAATKGTPQGEYLRMWDNHIEMNYNTQDKHSLATERYAYLAEAARGLYDIPNELRKYYSDVFVR